MANTKTNKSNKRSRGKTSSPRTGKKTAAVKKSSGRQTRKDKTGGRSRSDKKMLARTSGDAVVLRQQEGIPMIDEIGLVFSFGLMVLMMFSNFGLCGMVGMWLSSFFFGIFGVVQYVMPLAFFAGMTILLANDYSNLAMKKCGAAFVLLMTVSGFAQLLYPDKNVAVSEVFSLSVNHRECGGILGGGAALTLRSGFGTVGAAIILVCVFLLSAVLLTQRSLAGFYKNTMEALESFRADFRVKRARDKEERRIRRAEEAALEREMLTVSETAEPDLVTEEEEYDDIEEDDHGPSYGGGKPPKKRRGLFSAFRRTLPRKKPRHARPIDEKVEELEKRKRDQGASAFYFDSKAVTSESKKKSASPVFTSTDRLLRKDSVRELHPEAYPFSEDDGKSSPFDGELDYSAFSKYDRSELEDYIDKNRSDNKIKEEKPASGLTGEIRIHNMYDDELQMVGEEVVSAPETSVDEPVATVKAVDEPVSAVKAVTDRRHADRSGQDEAQLAAIKTDERLQMAPAAEEPEENSFHLMDAVTNDTDEPAPDEVLQQVTAGQAKPGTAKKTVSGPSSVKTADSARKDREKGQTRPDSQTGTNTPESKTADIRINRAAEPKALAEKKPEKKKAYVFPPVSLLVREDQNLPANHDKILKETAIKLQDTLKSFGVNVTITDISCGPAVTRYEMVPEQGTKVSKIVSLADDIKLNLAAADIRIEAPIPGKSAIGIEVPNKHVQLVHFRNLIDNRTFKHFKSKLAFAVGKDIGGKIVVTDLAKMPHLLIAGATGSGKSVCINTLIMSLIYKASPEEVKMIMVDPKIVELSVYNGIPHLLTPVVTDPKKASGALNWAVSEMTSRYQKFSETGVRNIEGYNKKINDLYSRGKVPEDGLEKMPQIVIIIDELADLMMVSPGEVEDAIVRLSQLARAAGIHLVIATQRPSVNVITGLIKANVPSRIAFEVSSGVDSRTILDMNGAEKLLGKGDMLFYPAGIQKPVRVQGAFITDEEIVNVVNFIKEKSGDSQYDDSVSEQIEKNGQPGAIAQDRDEYFEAAARFIMEKDKATIGMLQRMFKIGFNRAARIIDQLADAGIIGPEEGTKPRKILMSPEQLDQYFEEYL